MPAPQTVAGCHREMVMKDALRARIEAFGDEFPFALKFCYGITIKRLSSRPVVQRMDLDLLDMYPWTSRSGMRHGFGNKRYILLDIEGCELAEVKQHDVVKSKFSLWRRGTWSDKIVFGQTVYEAIRALKDQDRLAYVLEVMDLFSTRYENHDPDYGVEVILHKIPANKKISEWITQLRVLAQHELRSELTQLDYLDQISKQR
jgi:hypothetical protein